MTEDSKQSEISSLLSLSLNELYMKLFEYDSNRPCFVVETKEIENDREEGTDEDYY